MTKSPPPASTFLRVRGSVNKVRFRGEGGFAVLSATLENGEGKDDDATVVGLVPPLEAGDTFSAEVTLEEHREYGYQYRVQTLLLDDVPVALSEAGVAAYLEARVSGVGKVLAGRIARHFGAAALDLLSEDPQQLLKVPGVTQATLHKMVSSWEEAGGERRLMAALQGLGLSVSQAQRALKHFGSAALERLNGDIYALTEIEGIGFLSADKLAQARGVAQDDPRRLTAAAVYALQQAQLAGGHTYLPRERALRGLTYYAHVTPQQAEFALDSACELNRVIDDDGRIYLPPVLRAEKKLAGAIRTLLATPPEEGWKVTPQDARGLSGEQAEVLRLLEKNRLVVLTGGPGTGKSTTTRQVADLAEKLGFEVALCAPTGKAARRLGEVTGRNASTIHRLLGYGPEGFRFGQLEPLLYDLVIVDEVSMCGDALLLALLGALGPGSRVLLVGDADQLPPVDAGLPLLALTEAAPTVRLSRVYRQAAESPIVTAAHALLAGRAPQFGALGSDDAAALQLVEVDGDVAARRVSLLARELGGPGKVQVLSPMRKGPLGVEALNLALQGQFNPGSGGTRVGEFDLRAGDYVVQTKNDYQNEVFNGTQGIVLAEGGGKVQVDFEGNIVELSGSELWNLQLGYALTVHRAQGSEWRAVIGVLHEAHANMLSRNLAYTALTRASERFVAVGSRRAWEIAAGRRREVRHTHLLERIRGG